MASSTKGLRLLKTMEVMKKNSSFDASTVLSKTKLESACDGVLKGSFKVEPTMCNVGGTLHGGYIASVIDVYSFYSQLSNPDGRISWTVTMNVSYIDSAKAGDIVNVETKSLAAGSCSIIETILRDAGGQPLAKGTTSFIRGHEQYQQLFNEIYQFDVYEK